MEKASMCWAVALGLAVAQGAVVTFTGTTSADLAVDANWSSGTRPGAEDVAYVDFAALAGAKTLTFSSDLAFGGLVLTNVPSGAVVSGTNETTGAATALTLGAGGLVSHPVFGSSSNLTFNARLATAANQTWDFNWGDVSFNDAIGGNAELVVSNATTAVHNVPPAYEGLLAYAYTRYAVARLAKAGLWARRFAWRGQGRLELSFKDETAWSAVFPESKVDIGRNGYALMTLPGAPVIRFAEGDVFTNGYFVVDTGTFRQSGGHVRSNVQVGYAEYDSLYELTGGRLDATMFYLGNMSKSWSSYPKFVLDGGTMTAPGVWIGRRGGSELAPHDFTVKSGTLTCAENTSVSSGIILSYSYKQGAWDVQNSPSASYFQSGGVVHASRVALGGAAERGVDEQIPVTNSYCTFTLSGGLFELGAGGFIAQPGRWNEGQTTNSWYRIELKGGTLSTYADSSSELDTIVPAGSTATIDTQDKRFALNAPLKGAGSLAKVGTGTLVLADASRFTGDLAVNAGTLKLAASAAMSDGDLDADCVVWRAEDAVAELEDGAEVGTWPDTTGTRVATTPTFASNPTTIPVVDRDAFNGRPGVAFNHSALKVAAADNPLAGQTNWTLCVVFKTTTNGMGQDGSWYLGTGLVGREEGGIVDDWGLVLSVYGHIGAGLGVRSPSSDNVFYTSRNYADGQPHVAIYALAGDGSLTLSVDGEVVSRTVVLNTDTHSPRNVADIYFGVHNIADNGAPYKFAFTGAMAEIRFYPGTTLTWNQKAAVGAALAAKYGAASAVATIGNLDDDPVCGDVTAMADVVPELPDDGAAAWDADSITDVADGAEVAAWPSTNGTRTADKEHVTRMTGLTDLSSSPVSWNGPVLRKGAINGHNALVFNGSNTALAIPADDSPVSGATAWTAAVVFRTTRPGSTVKNDRNFYAASGLFGAELPNNTRADWGVGIWGEGNRVMAGYGGMNTGWRGDQSTVGRVRDLSDGHPHIAVCSFDTAAGVIRVVVDGVASRTRLTAAGAGGTPREAMRILLGSANCNFSFAGEIAAVRLYDSFIDDAAVKALTDAWAARYGVVTSSQFAHVCNSGSYGLAATNVSVGAGASLVLPVSTNRPFALAAGQTLAVAGTVRGTLGVAADGVFDMAAATPTALDDVWLQPGGVLRASFHQAAPVPLTTFRADKTSVIEMVDRPAKLPPKFPLFSYTGDAPDMDALACTIRGAAPNSTLIAENGRISLATAVGTMIILR